ncbi:hypothetical protein BRADI_2g11288v3 [Brachypodium distachyon]|uniref:Uncharacterized protein n=1 Tax=Brachypodium distachyon TaxID=15368 RepID=A0A2K2D7Y9_BRADI|nr:hypothetical protein BRADI_2g11288v3 [Brachypodium distachyon]
MNKVLVFHGDGIVRDGPSGLDVWGLDVWQCQHKLLTIEDIVNTSFLDITNCIKAEFGSEMASKKLIVEALLVPRVQEGSLPRWGLRQVKGESNWRTYMRLASTPDAAIYGRPMVYVQFDDDDEAGSWSYSMSYFVQAGYSWSIHS